MCPEWYGSWPHTITYLISNYPFTDLSILVLLLYIGECPFILYLFLFSYLHYIFLRFVHRVFVFYFYIFLLLYVVFSYFYFYFLHFNTFHTFFIVFPLFFLSLLPSGEFFFPFFLFFFPSASFSGRCSSCCRGSFFPPGGRGRPFIREFKRKKQPHLLGFRWWRVVGGVRNGWGREEGRTKGERKGGEGEKEGSGVLERWTPPPLLYISLEAEN